MTEEENLQIARAAAARARQAEVLFHLGAAYMEMTRANSPAADSLCEDFWSLVNEVVATPTDSFA